MWIDISEWLKMQKYLCCINVHPGWSQKRNILVVKLTGWHIPWISISVFPKPLLSLLNEFMNKVVMMTRIRVLQSSVAIVFGNTNFHSSGLTWLEPWLSAQSANSGNQQRFPYMAPYFRGINQLSGSRLSILDCLHRTRVSLLFLLK